MRILLVDDTPQVRKLIKGVYRGDTSHEFLEAEDGEQAWQILEHQIVDLLITDKDMPKMDGLELIQKVQKRYPQIQIILMTGDTTCLQSVPRGVIFLEKPFDLRIFKDIIQRIPRAK